MAEELGNYKPPPMFETLQYEAPVKKPKPIRTSGSTIVFPVTMVNKEKNGMPIPPRRPQKFNASESFIREVRAANNMGEHVAYSNNDQLENMIANPSIEELMKQLE